LQPQEGIKIGQRPSNSCHLTGKRVILQTNTYAIKGEVIAYDSVLITLKKKDGTVTAYPISKIDCIDIIKEGSR